jgi:predicted hydrocarbon binding protein
MTESLPRLSPEALDKLFSDAAHHFDLSEGTVAGVAERIIYLTEDLVAGIHAALTHEAGEAWGVILKSCGYVWGRRLALALEKKTRSLLNREMGQLAVDDYLALLEAYFSQHGWGHLTVHLDDAESHGIVRASLRHSLFGASLRLRDQPVDFLIAGLLRALFERIGDCPLECLQVAWAKDGAGEESSEFLISAPERIESIAGAIGEFKAVDDALARLRAA